MNATGLPPREAGGHGVESGPASSGVTPQPTEPVALSTSSPPSAAGGAAQLDLTARVALGLPAFLELETPWRELVERTSTANPFLSWEWVSEWATTFWGASLRTVLVENGRGAPVAIAPFLPHPGLPVPGLRAPALELMGPRRRWHWYTFELAEALVDESVAVPAFRLILQALAESGHWRWIEVAGWAEHGQWWREALVGGGVRFAVGRSHLIDSPVMELPHSWEEIFQHLSKQFRQNIRTAQHGLERQGFQLSYSELRGQSRIDAVLDDFFSLHAARAHAEGRTHHPDLFTDPARRDFIVRVIHRLADSGLLSVGSIELNGERVATQILMEMKGVLFPYRSGFDPNFWRYSIMTLALVEAIKGAISRGSSAVNFGAGLTPATARWNVRVVPYERLWVIRDTRRGRAALETYERLRSLGGRARQARSSIGGVARKLPRPLARRNG